MTISSVLSQQPSNNSVIVPISSLKNALLVKAERDDLKNQLKVSRDTIKTFSKVIFTQDSIIKVDLKQIDLYKKNEKRQDSISTSYLGIIKEKENQVSELQDKLTKSYIITGAVVVISVLLIVFL